jgi:hypothetical protein
VECQSSVTPLGEDPPQPFLDERPEPTGQLPFDEVTTEALRRSIRNERPNLSRLTGRLREVTEHCLQKDPAARPRAIDIADALRPSRIPKLQSTLVVAADGSGDCRTIGDALERVQPSGLTAIIVKPGLYEETLHLEHACEIRGACNSDRPIVESAVGAALTSVARSARIIGLTFRGTGVRSGITVEIASGSLHMEDCVIEGSTEQGIRLAGRQANPMLKNCTIEGPFRQP